MSHPQNKARFMQLIGENLEQVDSRVSHSTGDEDSDIALISVHESPTKNVTVVGENTDLLVLMLYFSWQPSCFKLLFRRKTLKNATEFTISTNTGLFYAIHPVMHCY